MTDQAFSISDLPVLSLNSVRLEPLNVGHAEGLAQAVQDGEIYNLMVTFAPRPEDVPNYIKDLLELQTKGQRYTFVVIEENTQRVIGTTSFYDLVADIRSLKIGYTWYAKTHQRTHVNTTCKLLLLQYAFEVLKANTVVFETDILNKISQKAIARLGAKQDGVLRGQKLRKDGSLRDTMIFSIIAEEWPAIQQNLQAHL